MPAELLTPTPRRQGLFSGVVLGLLLVAGLVLAGAAVVVWYWSDHLAAVATVNGQAINRDEYRTRFAIEQWRADYRTKTIHGLLAAGLIDPGVATAELTAIETAADSLPITLLDQMIDVRLTDQLAAERDLSINETSVDARLLAEATSPERRQISLIAIAPALSPGAKAPSVAQKAAAAARAAAIADQLAAGATFSDLAATISSGPASSAAQLPGWVVAPARASENSGLDPALSAALLAAPLAVPTGVIIGADGTAWIGLVTRIVPASADPHYVSELAVGGIDLAAYRAVLRGELAAEALQNAVLGTTPFAQRQVAEIRLTAGSHRNQGDEVSARIILYAPERNPYGLPPSVQAVKLAQARALAAYAKLTAGQPSAAVLADRFLVLAQAANGSNTLPPDGELPWTVRSELDPVVSAALFASGLKPGTVLAPVQAPAGWYLLEFLGRRAEPLDRISSLRSVLLLTKADFAGLARDNSEAADAGLGGDMGWVAQGQLAPVLDTGVFETPVGTVSAVVDSGTDLYLFFVRAAADRRLDAHQVGLLRSSVWGAWFANARAKADISRTTDALPARPSLP